MFRRLVPVSPLLVTAITALPSRPVHAQAARGGVASITSADLKMWLNALSSDAYEGRDVRGKVVVWIGRRGPSGAEVAVYWRLLDGRGSSKRCTELIRFNGREWPV